MTKVSKLSPYSSTSGFSPCLFISIASWRGFTPCREHTHSRFTMSRR